MTSQCTNVSLYWFTNNPGSLAPLDADHGHYSSRTNDEPCKVPVAVLVFPRDATIPVREIAAARHDIVRWNVADSGGHFAALARPTALIDDLRQFATAVH